MLPILIAAVLSSTPSITGPESGVGGELVATWVREDSKSRTSISLDADGRCAMIGRTKSDGSMQRVLCAYWLVGSTIHLRVKSEAGGPRPELELRFDREADELVMGDDSGQRFARRPLTERQE